MLKQMNPKRVVIGEYEFAIYPFGAFVSATISGDLTRYVGPVIAGLLPLMGDAQQGDLNDPDHDFLQDIMKKDLSEVVPILMMAVQQIDGQILQKLLKELLVDYKNISVQYRDEKGEVKMEQLTFENANDIFTQSLDGMIQLAIEVCKVNFSDFFSRLGLRFGSQRAIMDQQTQSSMDTSTQDGFAPLS